MSPSTSPCCSGATRRISSGTSSAASVPTRRTTSWRRRSCWPSASGTGTTRRTPTRPWLYGIATHLIGRHRRAEIRLYRAPARTGADPVTEPFTDRVDDRVSAGHASRKLAAALARLSAELRDTLLLAAWSNLSYEEIAAALGVPVGTVRSRLSRARGRLR
jgi:RNA polymerase sigma factor (sigma-70 family)